jgi:uncharacterized protein (TIGR02646 family)
MTTSNIAIEVRKRLRQELAQYMARPHRTIKHRAKSLLYIQDVFKESRKKGFEGWSRLDLLSKAVDDITGSELKAALRDQLVQLQSNRCCYCRRWLVNTAYARPIEHVLPQAHFRQFSFHFWNLAVACTDCNSHKSDTVWGGVDPARRKYPNYASIDKWFHPRFHTYNQHVRFVRIESNGAIVVLFRGVTEQGRSLCKTLLCHIAAKEMLIANNSSLNACLTALNEHGDRFNGLKAQKLRSFQDELSASITRIARA